MNNQDILTKLDKMINKLILNANRFIEVSAFPYGLVDLLKFDMKSEKLVYDYEYFVLTKSTKTLLAIRGLLKSRLNEDAIVLVRSIFENYLSCRYLNENSQMIDDFMENPLRVALAYYNVNSKGEIIDREQQKVGEIINPNVFKMGMDKKYYFDFYDFLSRFAHCNFGVTHCYLDKNYYFTTNKVSYDIFSRLFSVFVFTKIFEHVVTVEGEEFRDQGTEKKCYQLVRESIQLQSVAFELCIQKYSNGEDGPYKYRNKRMREMLKNMKKSLKEELGSVIKSI